MIFLLVSHLRLSQRMDETDDDDDEKGIYLQLKLSNIVHIHY